MPQQGQRVGEYILDEPLGKGAFGEVWRARHHVWLDQVVAVKIPTDPAYLRNLQREVDKRHKKLADTLELDFPKPKRKKKK